MAPPDSSPNSGPETPALGVDVVRRVARLSRLAITDEAAAEYARQLGAVLEHARALQSLDLAGVEPLVYPGDTSSVWREDEPGPALDRETLLHMAPDTDGPFLRVPKVIDGGQGA